VIDLLRAIRVELLKLRRTLALLAAVLVPLVVIVMTTIIVLARDPGRITTQSDPWDVVLVNFVLFLWCIVTLGPLIALESALLAGLEHRENTWKHLYALPVSRWSIYAAKLIAGAGLVVLSTIALDLGFVAEGLLLVYVRPDLGLTLPIPWSSLLGRSLDVTVASVFVLAIQTWVAIRWRSFPLAAGLGITGAIAGLVLSISGRAAVAASYFPWSLPMVAIGRFPDRPNLQLTAITVGVVGGIIAAILGCWDTIRQDVV
jgi:ABC-2 type transport system permease protein